MPAWPVIVLTMEDDAAVADPAGVGDPIRVAAYPDLEAAAETAASEAARRLNVSRCRVQGIGPDGEVFVMIVDTTTGTLEEIEPGGGASGRPSRAGIFSGVTRRFSGIAPKWWLVIGVSVVAVVAVGVVVVPRSFLPGPEPVVAAPAAQDNDAPVPSAGQLPVSAPAGWNTYASWVVSSDKPGAAAVLVGRSTLVLVDGSTVIGLDADTGQEKWRAGTPGNVTQLRVTDDRSVIYAARGHQGVTIIDAKTGAVLANADEAAQEIGLADVPFAQLPGQAGAVLVGTSWERRQVPATAVPVGTIGEGLVSVSIEGRRLWVTTSDSPVLPDAVPLVAPVDGLRLARVVAFVGGRLVTEWTDARSVRTLAIDTLTDDGQLERVAALEPSQAGSGSVSIDAASGLLSVGGRLINLATGQVVDAPSGALVVSAGYGWSTPSSSHRVRISADDGSVLDMARDAVIPDVILPDGRAVVRAAQGADGEAYYVLEVEQPRATPTPTTTPTE